LELFVNIGVDTIALTSSFPYLSQIESFLSDEWKKLNQTRNGKLVVYILKVPKNSKLPRLTLSQTPDYLWHLTVEVSFSSWLKGTNAELTGLGEIRDFLKALEKYVSEKSGLEFNVLRARLVRVDFALYILVGEQNKARIIRKLAFLELSRFDCYLINAETIYFQNKGKNYVITIYDKFAEMLKNHPDFIDIEKFRDYLKLEVRLRTVRIQAIADKLNLPNRSAENFLTQEVAEYVLSEAKAKLHLELFLVENDDWIADVYAELPPKEALKTVGFIASHRRFGRELQNGNPPKMHQRTYQRHIKKCLENGINVFE
jgi:Phage replication protein CRI